MNAAGIDVTVTGMVLVITWPYTSVTFAVRVSAPFQFVHLTDTAKLAGFVITHAALDDVQAAEANEFEDTGGEDTVYAPATMVSVAGPAMVTTGGGGTDVTVTGMVLVTTCPYTSVTFAVRVSVPFHPVHLTVAAKVAGFVMAHAVLDEVQAADASGFEVTVDGETVVLAATVVSVDGPVMVTSGSGAANTDDCLTPSAG